MHLSIRNVVSNKTNVVMFLTQFQCKSYPQSYATEIERCLDKIGSLPNKINTCRICTSNIRCGSGETVSGATVGESEW